VAVRRTESRCSDRGRTPAVPAAGPGPHAAGLRTGRNRRPRPPPRRGA
jgi:hypothetical protein